MKHGGYIQRHTPLRVSNGLNTASRLKRTSLRQVNPERQKKRQEAGLVYGPYHRWIGTLACLVKNWACYSTMRGHHVKSIGAGGQDHGNEVPLCDFHHLFELPSMGRKAFEEKHGVDLAAEADQLKEHYPWKATA